MLTNIYKKIVVDYSKITLLSILTLVIISLYFSKNFNLDASSDALLLEGDKDTPNHIRFKKISKRHVHMFLKETGNSRFYDNFRLIHYNLTGIKPDDITYLENMLMHDK